jgi:hypothetical protein
MWPRTVLVASCLMAAVACERPAAPRATTIATDVTSWESTYAAARGRSLSVVDVRHGDAALQRVCAGSAQAAAVSQRPKQPALRCGDRTLELKRVGELSLVVAKHPKNRWAGAFDPGWIQAIANLPGERAPLWSDLDPAWPAEALTLFCPAPDDELWQIFVDSVGGEGVASRLGCRPLDCEQCSDWLSEDRGALVWAGASSIDRLGFARFLLPDGHVRWQRGLFVAFWKPEAEAMKWLTEARRNEPDIAFHTVGAR